MVMTAYFDESGTHGAESPVTIVAGFGGTAPQWAGVEKRLNKLYSDFGVPGVHAADFRGSKGNFKGWNAKQKGQFSYRFLTAIDSHLSFGTVGLVASSDYRKYYRAKPFPRKVRPDTEYGICFRAALIRSIGFMRDRADLAPLNVILELGHKNQEDAVRVFDDEKKHLPLHLAGVLGSISFASKVDCQFLAVADSLAYAMFRNSAGYTQHPDNPDAVPVGHSDPPFYVERVPTRRVTLSAKVLSSLYLQHIGKRPRFVEVVER